MPSRHLIRSPRHRRRHQRRRHRARRRGPRPVGAAGRAGRPRVGHVAVEHQADPRRPALPRALRVPAGRRGARRARGAAARMAPHLVEPLSFVLPHEPHLRPAWMIRAGLFLYDHLGRARDAAGLVRRRPVAQPWSARAQAALPQGLRLFRCARRRRAPRRRQRARRAGARRRHPRAHDASSARASASGGRVAGDAARRDGRDDGSRPRAALVNAAGPWVKRGARHRASATAVEGRRAPRQGQPHRRAARARGGARVHPAERRQAHRLRDSVPGALFADRHHRRAGRRRTSIRAISDDEIDYLLDARQRAISRSRSRAPTSCGPTAACGRSTTTARPIRRRSRATTCSRSTPTASRRRAPCCRSSAARSRPTASSPSTRCASSRRSFRG